MCFHSIYSRTLAGMVYCYIYIYVTKQHYIQKPRQLIYSFSESHSVPSSLRAIGAYNTVTATVYMIYLEQ